MKKTLAILIATLLMVFSLAASAEPAYLVFSTGGTTGVYYIFGGELATLWMSHVQDADVTVQSSGGSKDNILALYQGGSGDRMDTERRDELRL